MLLRFLPVPSEPRASERGAGAGAAARCARPPARPAGRTSSALGTLTWPLAITRPSRPSQEKCNLARARAHTHTHTPRCPTTPRFTLKNLLHSTRAHKPCFSPTNSPVGLTSTNLSVPLRRLDFKAKSTHIETQVYQTPKLGLCLPIVPDWPHPALRMASQLLPGLESASPTCTLTQGAPEFTGFPRGGLGRGVMDNHRSLSLHPTLKPLLP